MQKTNLYETVIKNGYDVGSGALAVADKNIKVELNEYGEYVSLVASGNARAFGNPKLSLISAMSNDSPDESKISENLYAKVPNIKFDRTIGYYLDLYAGHVVEGDYRKNASSGGFGTWIIKELLERKLINGVIHVKEAHDGDGILFKYDISTTIDEVKAGAKSKYYPAEFSEAIRRIKKSKGKYAIVGIPSIIMELRLLALQDKEVKDRIAFTIGLICGHQKSTKYAECLAWECGIKPGDLEKIDFRMKVEGRPASDYDTVFTGKVNGSQTTIVKRTSELFASTWGHGMFKVKFSDFTDDALNETADVSLGDAWLPKYTADWQGTNIVIVRNPTIAQIISKGSKKGLIHVEKTSTADVVNSQSGLIHHTRDELPYRLKLAHSSHQWYPKKRLVNNKISILKKYVQKTRLDIYEASRRSYNKAVDKDDLLYFSARVKPLIAKYQRVYTLIRFKSITPLKIWGKVRNKIGRD